MSKEKNFFQVAIVESRQQKDTTTLLTDPQINMLLLAGRRPPVANRHVLGIVGGAAV